MGVSIAQGAELQITSAQSDREVVHMSQQDAAPAKAGRKVIITCAVTGSVHTPTMTPYLPITPDQIAAESIAAAEAGAAVIHLHARDPKDGRPTPSPDMFMQFLPRIKQNCDAVVNITYDDSGGEHNLRWEWSDDVDWEPQVEMTMNSEVANKYFQGKENVALAIARDGRDPPGLPARTYALHALAALGGLDVPGGEDALFLGHRPRACLVGRRLRLTAGAHAATCGNYAWRANCLAAAAARERSGAGHPSRRNAP